MADTLAPRPPASLDEALTHWRQKQAENPADAESSRMIARLTIEQNRRRAGLGAVERSVPQPSAIGVNFPGLAFPRAADTATAPGESSWSQLTRIQQLEAGLREQPSRVDWYLELVPLYLAKGRDYEAERLLARGMEATGSDARVRQAAEDVTMLRLASKLAAAERELETGDVPAAREAVEQATKERDRVEIEIFTARMRCEPQNRALRYELGRRLRRAGNLAAARERLEEALHEPRVRSAAAFELGECFQQEGRAADALRHYRIAADNPAEPDQFDFRTDALLEASKLAGQMRFPKLARRYLAWLLKIDPSHRGGAALLDKLDESRSPRPLGDLSSRNASTPGQVTHGVSDLHSR